MNAPVDGIPNPKENIPVKKPRLIEAAYQQYLKSVGKKEIKMPMHEVKSSRMAFYGAFGKLLLYLQDDNMTQEECGEGIKSMFDELEEFWSIGKPEKVESLYDKLTKKQRDEEARVSKRRNPQQSDSL